MPESGRLRRLIQGQGGSTIIELLVAMPMAIGLIFGLLSLFNAGAGDQRDMEQRSRALQSSLVGLERMTRDLRQAAWVHVFSSQVVSAQVRMRDETGVMAPRHVRYDCSSGACRRLEGPAVAYPPALGAPFDRNQIVIGGDPGDPRDPRGRVLTRDVFVPYRTDAVTGVQQPNFVDPSYIAIRVRLAVKGTNLHNGPREALRVDLSDGVAIRSALRTAP